MFSCLVVSNWFLWYIHDTFYWVISSLCLQGLQPVEEQPQPCAGWQVLSSTHCIKWQGHALYCGTVRDKISLFTLALPSTTTPHHLSTHSAQGQGADETWNGRKLQVLSALVGEEELGFNGRAKMQLSFGYCHLSYYVLALQPSREAVLASVLTLQCFTSVKNFSASLDSWGAGSINKEGGMPFPHWNSRLRTRKDRFVHLYGRRQVHECCWILLQQSDISQTPRLF